MAERDGEPRDVPLDVPLDVTSGSDTDADGRADTVVFGDGVDLVVAFDLDGDGFADEVLRIGPDAVVRAAGPEPDGPDGLFGCGVDGDQ